MNTPIDNFDRKLQEFCPLASLQQQLKKSVTRRESVSFELMVSVGQLIQKIQTF